MAGDRDWEGIPGHALGMISVTGFHLSITTFDLCALWWVMGFFVDLGWSNISRHAIECARRGF